MAIWSRSTEQVIFVVSRIQGQDELLELLQALDTIEADEKRNGSEDTEAAVDETPGEGNASDGTGDQGERNDRDAGDQAELENPLVADGVAQRAEEGNGKDKVREGEPVGSVGEERVV